VSTYAGWRRDRMPVLPDTPAFTQAPDWVREVISPSTGRIDRSRKMRIYARERVAHLSLVEPLHETLEVYRLEAGRWIVIVTHAGDDAVRAEPFDAIELRLERWWMPPNERLRE
jgi:Uma2 family endonuclease